MKKFVIILVTAAILIAIGLWFSRWRRQRAEQECVNNMELIYSAAISSCLEQAIKHDRLFTVEELRPYVGRGEEGRLPVCPIGNTPYPPFTIATGPLCPNGHYLAPGEKRPFRAARGNKKLAGVYRSFGWTNLIDTR